MSPKEFDRLKPGDVVWTLEPSIESESCDCGLCGPHEVKVSIEKRPDGIVHYGHAFEGDEIDDDSNATCFLSPKTTYKTELKALGDYITYLVEHRKSLMLGIDQRLCGAVARMKEIENDAGRV